GTSRFPQKGTLLAIYSRCVNTAEPLERALAERFPWCLGQIAHIKRIFQEFSVRKIQRGLLDYDDLLLYWEQALDTPSIGNVLAGRFQHVLVDEYQDTNPVQAGILRKMWALMKPATTDAQQTAISPDSGSSIMVVGDDAQSIYSFRGATVENILR